MQNITQSCPTCCFGFCCRSDYLFFWDADTFVEKRFVKVTLPHGEPLWHLNELEVINGSILANVWYSNKVKIASSPLVEEIIWCVASRDIPHYFCAANPSVYLYTG